MMRNMVNRKQKNTDKLKNTRDSVFFGIECL